MESNPWGDKKCGRPECFVCRGEKGGIRHCMKESILYSIKCEEYSTRGKQAEYWGETGRDGYVRGGEHLKGCKEKNEENALWKHIEGEHRGEDRGDEMFTMKIEKGFRKALARQISEGVSIEMCEGILLNSKSEWNNSKIPRIIIEEGEKQREDKDSGLGNKSERGKQKKGEERQVVNRQRNKKRGTEGGGEPHQSRDNLNREQAVKTNKKRKITEKSQEIEGGSKIQTEKRKSRETEIHQREVRKEKITRKQRDSECVEIEKRGKKVKETGGEYWREVFQRMARQAEEKRRGIFVIRGVQKHVLRLAESRAGEGKATTKEALSSEGGEVNVDSRENHSGRESHDSDKMGGFGGASCPQGGGV